MEFLRPPQRSVAYLQSIKGKKPDAKGGHFMSQFVSLPPMSPGIAYAVRKLLACDLESISEARQLCARLWPKMDPGAVQVVLAYWSAQFPTGLASRPRATPVAEAASALRHRYERASKTSNIGIGGGNKI